MDIKYNNLFDKITKYIIEWLVILFAIKCVPKQCVSNEDIFKISTIGMCTFIILDIFFPSIRVEKKDN